MFNSIPKVRFAPSPTGFLHVGNIRAAIINFLYAKKFGGKFFLRLDDTDEQRVRDEYREMIFEDMKWLGLEFDDFFKQSSRLERYEEAKQKLLASGRIYECFETTEELNLQRKNQVASGIAPIYNRAALKLTKEQKEELRAQGIRPHYRFLLSDDSVAWDDKIKGLIRYDGRNFSDPVLIRAEDETGFGVPTYTFCSVVDDIDYEITDIIRGEDHITNTAIQIQIFEALGSKAPNFAHLALVKAMEGKISKREGGFDVKTLRLDGYEPMAIVSLLSQIGTSDPIRIFQNYDDLVQNFSFEKFSKSATNYDIAELSNINQKLLLASDFNQIESRAKKFSTKSGVKLNEEMWLALRSNINFLHEIESWLEIFKSGFRYQNSDENRDFLNKCSRVLPQDTENENAWNEWLAAIKNASERKGKDLFMPIRLALTGKEHGPELKFLVNLISREEILARLT